MFDVQIYAAGLAVSLVMAVIGWLLSVGKQDVSIADSLWPLLFLAMTITYLALAPALAERAYLLLFLVTVWAVRLSVFITLRNWGEPEDRRYQALRTAHDPGFGRKSFYLVFGTQAILAWVISLPLLGVVLGATPLGWVDFLAVGLWLLGFFFEAIGDQQLAHFRADPANRSRVLDRGLWRYSRHPNYFGEACIWWAWFLFAVAAGAWWTILGPLLMTFLLLRVGGVPLLEQGIGERRPAYRDYTRRTNTLLPGPPRAPASL
jgi:steroid 5-alpha reductase family enzyme